MDRAPGRVNKGNNTKIVVGMSGGVDSTASLILLKKNGWDPIGLSLKLPFWEKGSNLKENPKSTSNSIKKAEEICNKYGCEHHTLDITKEFQNTVVDYFVNTLEKGQTPNPCMVCNRNTKFFHLIKFADSKGIKYISTGHYAKVTKSKKYGSYFLSTPKDKSKDQTYYLSLLPEEWLKRIIFPLGELTKKEAYTLVKNEGLSYFKETPQSQDFCYIPEKSMDQFIEKEIDVKPGNIVDKNGNYLGKHRGLQHYTIGQRKKIGLPEGPYYVVKKDTKDNEIVVTTNKKDLGETEIILSGVFFPIEKLYGRKLKVKAKIRYQNIASSAELFPVKETEKKYKIIFKKPQIGVTPGQYAVFYIGKLCVGSGVISL